MKAKILLCLLPAIALHVLSAFGQATQPCLVLQYNQKAAKTPLPGVEVMASNAGSTVSDDKGHLTLTFRTLKPGDKVKLISAKKAGYEVFNTEAVDQWMISRDQTPFTLVLVKKDVFDQLKARLTETSSENYTARYLASMKEVEKLRQEGKLQEEEYNQRLDELENDYQTRLQNLDNYIDQFARIDLSEVSAEERHILDMVQEGRIDEAVKAYEALDISGKLRQARENKQALAAARSKLEEEEKSQDLAIRELKAKLERELATLQLAGGKENFDKIARIMKENALADTTDLDALFKYANFAYHQRDFGEAEYYWLMCLRHEDADPEKKASIHNNLGTSYITVRDYSKAEEHLLQSLAYIQVLFNADPETYRDGLADTQNNLGNLYFYLRDYPKAEEYLLQALKNKEILLDSDPENNQLRKMLAGSQNNLGLLYRTTRDYPKAEEYLRKSVENCTMLVNQNPDTYRESLYAAQLNLGNLFLSLRDNEKALEYYLQALDNIRILFDRNPDAFRKDLSETLFNLGSLYQILSDFPKAETCLMEAVENMTVLYESHPAYYRTSLAKMLGSLAKLEYWIEKDAQALEAIDRAISLQPDNPRFYDTKGLLLLAGGDEAGALEMWQKIQTLDPELKGWRSSLQKQLKGKGLIE